MKTKNNDDILLKYFWGHVQFGWRHPSEIATRGRGYRAFRALIVELTMGALARMRNAHEQAQVRALLEERYGPDLVPSEAELGFPEDSSAEDLASWQVAFDRFTTLYGVAVGDSRRLRKDVRKYKTHQGLLKQPLHFVQRAAYSFRSRITSAESGGQDLIVLCQEFPREHLYRVEANGETILEFDDWPKTWAREWAAA